MTQIVILSTDWAKSDENAHTAGRAMQKAEQQYQLAASAGLGGVAPVQLAD